MFALVDCNNFYASCERVFNPKLENQPIVILSNNDGCVIARSNQAKALGIGMGVPYFQIKNFCRQKKVAVYSSNYVLYGDMSQRVMSILNTMSPATEIYSIDEAFLKFENDSWLTNFYDYGILMRKKILQYTGLPVSIGFAPTKTLAKVANYVAKKETITGVYELKNVQEWKPILEQLTLSEIWGIAERTAVKLKKLGILTPYSLSQADPKWIRSHFNVVMERIVYELKGVSCIDLEKSTATKKQIISSRSFRNPATKIDEVITATTRYVMIAFEKLRKQNSVTSNLQVFLSTSPFDKNSAYKYQTLLYKFTEPTQDSRLACEAVSSCIRKMYKTGRFYKKSGVVLSDIIDSKYQINNLFPTIKHKNSKQVMNLMDAMNQKFGRNTLFLAAQGREQNLETKSNYKSACYTTRWQDLLVVT